MFGGDKNNSLAFCDMSNLQVSRPFHIILIEDFNEKPQTARRRLLGPHTFPAAGLAIIFFSLVLAGVYYVQMRGYRPMWQPVLQKYTHIGGSSDQFAIIQVFCVGHLFKHEKVDE